MNTLAKFRAELRAAPARNRRLFWLCVFVPGGWFYLAFIFLRAWWAVRRLVRAEDHFDYSAAELIRVFKRRLEDRASIEELDRACDRFDTARARLALARAEVLR